MRTRVPLQLLETTPATTMGGDTLDTLYARHAADIKRWVRRLAGPTVDLDDLMHDVFVIALRRPFVERGQGSVRTWLFRITHHVVLRRRRRHRIRTLLFGQHRTDLESIAPPPSTPQDEIERHERHVRLYRALDRIPDAYRSAVILYEIEGLPGEEVAEILGISLGTLWVRLHRGRAKLIALLAEEEGA